MQTLFDLMIMAFKYQCKMIVQPEEIYFITKKHIQNMKELIAGTPNVSFIDAIAKKFETMCENFSSYDYLVIRQ